MKKQTTLNAMPYWFCTILFFFFFATINVANAQTATTTKASTADVVATQAPTVSMDDLQKQKNELEAKVAAGTATDADNAKLNELTAKIKQMRTPQPIMVEEKLLPPADDPVVAPSNTQQSNKPVSIPQPKN